MKKILALITAVAALALTGCNYEIVPPAHKGKIYDRSGYHPEVLEVGRHNTGFHGRLVLIESKTGIYSEDFRVTMADKLTLTGSIKFQGRISGNDTLINSMFNDLTVNSDNVVGFDDVYGVYGRMHVESQVRSVLSKYTVEDVHKNRDRIVIEIGQAIVEKLDKKPLVVSDIALVDLDYPDVVTNAIEKAEERRQQIEQEKAQMNIEILQRENDLILAQADREIELTRARTISEANAILAEGVTQELLELKRLENNKIIANNAGKANSTIYLPVEGLTSTGASVRMFK